MVRHICTFVLVVLSAASASGISQRVSLHKYEATRMSMGCAYSIVAFGGDAAALPHIVADALDEVDRIDRLMSHYKADSELSRINRDAARQPVTIDAELFDFIAEAMLRGRDGPSNAQAWSSCSPTAARPATRWTMPCS